MQRTTRDDIFWNQLGRALVDGERRARSAAAMREYRKLHPEGAKAPKARPSAKVPA